MKQLILKRIEEIRKNENNFSRGLMRWQKPLTHGTITKYADEINFEELSDEELLFLFERIIRRINLAM